MNIKHIYNKGLFLVGVLSACLLSAGCSDDIIGDENGNSANGRILLSPDIDQLALTRVNDNGFCDGDVIGVYVVDYAGNEPKTLLSSGNHGDNVRHTFDEVNHKWKPAYELYWKDKHTHIDVYGYYPYASVESVDEYAFEVKRDQSTVSSGGDMGGYEASDFLWGKASDIAPTETVISLSMKHRMSNACVTLIQGSGFADGEWANTEKTVLASNVVRKAKINMSDGTVRPDGGVEQTATVPSRTGDEWRTIVVPQTVQAGMTLFSITIGGVPYKFVKNEAFEYVAGKMMKFGIRVDKKADSGQYKLTLVSESIAPWENDLVSHDATAKEYVVVNSTAGHLKEAIEALHKDYTTLKNLKLTGEINAQDFYFMRDEMEELSALNLKEVIIRGGEQSIRNGDDGSMRYNDYEIPSEALKGKKSLNLLVLPDRLKKINIAAFADDQNITGSLVIPEGVEEIEVGAFYDCRSMTGALSLPSTLKYLGRGIDRWWFGGVFTYCGFNCELILPNKLECIASPNAFCGCEGLYGELRLPEKLTDISDGAFAGCTNLTGSITIPQGVHKIPNSLFADCNSLNGTLNLHDGITSIGEMAFSNTALKGELKLPKSLIVISQNAFEDCDFSGELTLPKAVRSIGNAAFKNNDRLMGTVEFPEGLQSIGQEAFCNCRMLEGLVFPESLESIRNNAFEGCYGISSIVCKSEMPARLLNNVFDGVAKDNFTLEVPESAVQQYQSANGWRDFKRIAAHHELTCRPQVACALATQHKQTLVVNAEGEWEVASKPDWCEVSPSSGNKKTQVTLTISSMSKNGSNREGKIVFRLKDKDYTHECSVSQYDYEYEEDQWLALQKATKGKNGGINIVLIGDGFDAKDISSGDYLKTIKQEVEYFFGIEPYKTYRSYFNVYTAFPLSTETGVGTVNTIRYNRFNTTFTSGTGLKADYDEIFDYVLGAPTVTKDNLNQTLIIVVPHSTDYGGICQMWESGAAIAFCPLSTYDYPLDSRGVVQHEAGGHGFGKLGDEYIYHNAFIDACGCSCCPHDGELRSYQSLGWFENLSLTSKMHSVGWSHLIYDSRYSDIVDIYEGGYMHNRGVFRSEQNSCMNNDIPYYSTISRESIVKRIMRYAGETYSFEDFVKADRRDAGNVTRRAGTGDRRTARTYQHSLVIHKGNPLRMTKVRKHHR